MDIRCVTNLDDYHCHIRKTSCRPIVGDYIAAEYKGSNHTSLKVVRVTHKESEGGPYLLVELNN